MQFHTCSNFIAWIVQFLCCNHLPGLLHTSCPCPRQELKHMTLVLEGKAIPWLLARCWPLGRSANCERSKRQRPIRDAIYSGLLSMKRNFGRSVGGRSISIHNLILKYNNTQHNFVSKYCTTTAFFNDVKTLCIPLLQLSFTCTWETVVATRTSREKVAPCKASLKQICNLLCPLARFSRRQQTTRVKTRALNSRGSPNEGSTFYYVFSVLV